MYESSLNSRDRTLEDAINTTVFPNYIKNRFLEKLDFLTVCAWKTPRSKSRCESNADDYIRDISSLVLTTSSEQLRIEIWTLLRGVSWPTASVFLHFAFPDRYPILDFRAIWSMGGEVPKQYTFSFWNHYCDCCRKLAAEHNVSMRTLDQSLWLYSKLHQT